MLSNNHFFGASSQRRGIFWRCCIDMKLWEANTYVYIYILIIFILYLWLPVVSSNIYQYTTLCNKDSHVMKKARWSCRRRNRLSCSSCRETRKPCFWPRVSRGFIPEQGTVGIYWWQIFIWIQGDWDWTSLTCLRCISFFPPKTSDLRLKFIEQAKEQHGYLMILTHFQNQQFVHIINIPLWKLLFHQPNLCQQELLCLDDHCHGSLVNRLSFFKPGRSGKEWYGPWTPQKNCWLSFLDWCVFPAVSTDLQIFSGSTWPVRFRSWLRQNFKRSPCLEVRRKGFKDSWRWWNPWCLHFSHRSFWHRHVSLMRFLHDGVLFSQVFFLTLLLFWIFLLIYGFGGIVDKAKRVLKVEPTRQDLLRTWHPDKNPENLKVVWKLRYNHIGILRKRRVWTSWDAFGKCTKSTLKVEEGVTFLNLSILKLPSWNEDLLTQSPNRNTPVNKVLRHMCCWKQLRLFLISARRILIW